MHTLVAGINSKPSGYSHPLYAESLKEFGVPRYLPNCAGWMLERKIPHSPYTDAIGCYPLFSCLAWRNLHIDLEALNNIVSLTLVTDPFGDYDIDYLSNCFKHLVVPFKEHFIIDLGCDMQKFISRHHQKYADRAMREVSIEECIKPQKNLDEWIDLYANLVRKHNIKGIPAFSKKSFGIQLTVPGITAFRAIHKGNTVGMLLWYIEGETGYYHLGAYSDPGYRLYASFGLFWFAIQYFSAIGLKWLLLGSGAGLKSSAADGLARFKKGWATGTRTAYLCGRIFDQDTYNEIFKKRGIVDSSYFPAYRKDEFN